MVDFFHASTEKTYKLATLKQKCPVLSHEAFFVQSDRFGKRKPRFEFVASAS